jgi:4-hydroxybenzoate polyprenyltransferase
MWLRLAQLASPRGDSQTIDLTESSHSKRARTPHETPAAINYQQRIIDFVRRNRIYLGPGAALIIWALPPWYGSTPSWNALASVFLAGFGIYQLNRVYDVIEDEINDPDAYAQIAANKKAVRNVAVGAILTSFFLSAVLMSYLATATLSIMLLLGVLYSVPFFKREYGDPGRAKQIAGVKNAIPSVVWPVTTILYPAMSSSDVRFPELWLAMAVLSCSVFTIEVAWDVRDSRGDQAGGISTLATAFGARRALLVPLVASCTTAVVITFLVYAGNIVTLWLLPALLLITFPSLAYLWKDSLALNRDRSHFLVLINISGLVPLGLAVRWMA